MRADQFRVCTGCAHDVNGHFTTQGTDSLAPFREAHGAIAYLLIHGCTVTYHDHEETP